MDQVAEWTFEGGLKGMRLAAVKDAVQDIICDDLDGRRILAGSQGAGGFRVGCAGNRTRYQSGVYDSTCESGRRVKMSGTAIIRNYYRLR